MRVSTMVQPVGAAQSKAPAPGSGTRGPGAVVRYRVTSPVPTGHRRSQSKPAPDASLRCHGSCHGRRFRIAALVLACPAALVSLTACASGTVASPREAPPAARPTGNDPARAAAEREILAAYDGYQRAVMTASVQGDLQAQQLAGYAADPLLGQTRRSLAKIAGAGLINKGTRRWSPRITTVQLDQQVASATIEDCTDTIDWLVVQRSTGKPAPAPSGRPRRYLVISAAERLDGRWYIVESTGRWDQPC